MSLYDKLAAASPPDRVLRAEDHDREFGDFTRPSTLVHLHGDGQEGLGEDVVYTVLDHIAHRDAGPVNDFTGVATLGEFCELARRARPVRGGARPSTRPRATTAAGPTSRPRSTSRCARAGVPLHEAVGRDPKPLRFVCSTRLGGFGDDGDRSSTEPIAKRLAQVPRRSSSSSTRRTTGTPS